MTLQYINDLADLKYLYRFIPKGTKGREFLLIGFSLGLEDLKYLDSSVRNRFPYSVE